MKIRRENGAALFTALILLVILTLLGLSSMSTNIMEERMAANTQENYRAFQAAEAGLDMVFADDAAFNITNYNNGVVGTTYDPDLNGDGTNTPGETITVGGATVNCLVTYTQRGPNDDHFDVRSTANLPSGARVILHLGVNVPR